MTRLHGRLTPSQVFVIGDTPRDVEAAAAEGRFPSGVATGKHSVDEPAAAGGAHVLKSLEDAFPGL